MPLSRPFPKSFGNTFGERRQRLVDGIKVTFLQSRAERIEDEQERQKAFLHACAAGQPEGTDQTLF